MRIANISLEMNNAFFKLLRRAHIPPQTPPWSLTLVTAPQLEAVLDPSLLVTCTIHVRPN